MYNSLEYENTWNNYDAHPLFKAIKLGKHVLEIGTYLS